MASRTSTALNHPERANIEFGRVLAALADPVRLNIVATLASDGEVMCGTFVLPVTKSTATWHFRVLREAGVIRQRDEGNRRINTLRRDDLDQRFPGLLDMALTEAQRRPPARAV